MQEIGTQWHNKGERENLFFRRKLSFIYLRKSLREMFQGMKTGQWQRFTNYRLTCGYWICNLSSCKSTSSIAYFQKIEKTWIFYGALKYNFSKHPCLATSGSWKRSHSFSTCITRLRIQIFHLLITYWELEIVLKCPAFPLICSTLSVIFLLFTWLCLEANSCWCRKRWHSHSKPMCCSSSEGMVGNKDGASSAGIW